MIEFSLTESKLKYNIEEINVKKLNPDSLVAKILEEYNLLDKEMAQISAKTPCKKGCFECCTSNFAVSMSEFFTIISSLGIGNSLIRYSKRAREIIRDFSLPNKLDNDEIPNKILLPPCIFVDEKDFSCKIYSVRPALCRVYGYINEASGCPKQDENTELSAITNKINELCIANI